MASNKRNAQFQSNERMIRELKTQRFEGLRDFFIKYNFLKTCYFFLILYSKITSTFIFVPDILVAILISRSNRPEVLYKNSCSDNFRKSSKKHLRCNSPLIKLKSEDLLLC